MLIGNGRYSHSGLLHTILIPLPWLLFLNPSSRSPIAYHSALELRLLAQDMVPSS